MSSDPKKQLTQGLPQLGGTAPVLMQSNPTKEVPNMATQPKKAAPAFQMPTI